MMYKHVFKIFNSVLWGAAGLLIITTGFLQNDEPDSSIIKGKDLSGQLQLSPEFSRYEYLLLNSGNISGIDDSVENLDDNFERTYLTALIKKRNGDYKESFNLIFPLLKNYPRYYSYYDELIITAEASDNTGKMEEILLSGKLAGKYGDYLSALYFYHSNQYLKAAELLKDKTDFETLYLLSYAYRGSGDYDSAMTIMTKAESLLEKNDYNSARVFISLGSLSLLSGNYTEAEKLYKNGLESALESGDRREEIKGYINLAILDDQNGRIDEAVKKLQLALQKAKDIENRELEATALSELAVSYTYSANVVEAKNNYEKSFELFRILNHRERLSNLCANIAALYLQTANFSSAIKFYNDGLSYAGENTYSKILNLRGLGDVYSNLSDYSKALEYYEEAKQLSLHIKNAEAEASADVSIGTLYYNVNKPGKALRIFSEALNKMDAEADPYSREDVYFKMGLAYSAVDSLEQSNKLLEKGYELSESLQDVYYQAVISTELGHNYFLLGDFPKAEGMIIKGMNLTEEYGLTQLHGLQNLYLGKIAYAQGKFENAVKYFRNASEKASEIKDYQNLFESEYQLAKTFLTQKKYPEAEKHYLIATGLSDKISESLINNSEIQISHFSGFYNCYNELAELYLEQERNEEAFLVIEKSHSRNTLQNLSDMKINLLYNDKEKLNRFYDLRWMINSSIYSGSRLAELENEYERLRKNIYADVPELRSMLEKSSQLPVKEIQNNLTDKENLVTLFFGKNNSYFINVTRDEFKVTKIAVSAEEITSLLGNIAPLYAAGGNVNGDLYLNQDLFSFNTREAHVFYKKVIEPVVKDIPAGEMLIFSMPSELVFVPLEFLVTGFKEDDSPFYYANKHYLIEDYPVSYSPSASIYVLQKTMKPLEESKVLLVGDPKINDKDFALSYRGSLLEDDSFSGRNIALFPLRYSHEEIEKLNSLFDNGLVLLSDDATEKKFKENASGSSIIHLSTHSFLFNDQPFIIFSRNEDQNEDGYLETSEIHQLKLNTDLVVLSSCRSGLGVVDNAEGIIGMQKSFFEAGAKSVVVSLWDVNDKYTSLFMQSFYKFLSEGFDKTQSLQKAKLFFKNNYSANPYYWSAFVLSGDVSRINNIKAGSPGYLLFILAGIIISALAAYFLYRRKLKYKN